jgi:hypothetical protein
MLAGSVVSQIRDDARGVGYQFIRKLRDVSVPLQGPSPSSPVAILLLLTTPPPTTTPLSSSCRRSWAR